MPRSTLVPILLALCAFLALPAAGREAMDCSIGPVEKTFGGTRWLVHGCSDGKSVVVLSAPGNPAMPFYFFLFASEEGYRLHGEGAGDRAATRPAYDELSAALSASFVGALHAEAVVSATAARGHDGS